MRGARCRARKKIPKAKMDVVEVSPSALQIGVFVLCASIIIQIVGGVFYIVNACRRKPSIDETLRRDYVRRTEFEKLAADCRDDFRRIDSDIPSQRAYTAKSNQAIFDELRRLSDGVNRELQDLNKAIGRIEGKIDAPQKQALK